MQNIQARVIKAIEKGDVEPEVHGVLAATPSLSLSDKRAKELTGAVDRCFKLLQDLGTACPRYEMCFGASANHQFRNLQRAAFSSGFTSTGGLLSVRRRAESYFVGFRALGWDPWGAHRVASCSICFGFEGERPQGSFANASGPSLDRCVLWCVYFR